MAMEVAIQTERPLKRERTVHTERPIQTEFPYKQNVPYEQNVQYEQNVPYKQNVPFQSSSELFYLTICNCSINSHAETLNCLIDKNYSSLIFTIVKHFIY